MQQNQVFWRQGPCYILTGGVAGVIDIGASWLSDVKEGICRDAFWLNKEQCCWSANDTTLEYDRCKQVSVGDLGQD